jgi:tetratricopeptide (TPR) repeat protein
VTALILLLALAGPAEEALGRAHALAARAKRLEGEARRKAADEALEAYAALLEAHPKNRRLAPYVRRRRADLLRRCGRVEEALREHDAIVAGPARRKDKARALCDGARILEKAGDFHAAEERLRRAVEGYPDVTSTRAKASLARGRVLEAMSRPAEARKAYRLVVERCRDRAKEAIAAYDALALLAIKEKDAKGARRWLKACTKRFAKRAARRDRFGAFLARQLGAMKAPAKLEVPD